MVVYDEEHAFSEKQPDYFRIDLRFAYRWEMRSSTNGICHRSAKRDELQECIYSDL